jgi:hypothetical protein
MRLDSGDIPRCDRRTRHRSFLHPELKIADRGLLEIHRASLTDTSTKPKSAVVVPIAARLGKILCDRSFYFSLPSVLKDLLCFVKAGLDDESFLEHRLRVRRISLRSKDHPCQIEDSALFGSSEIAACSCCSAGSKLPVRYKRRCGAEPQIRTVRCEKDRTRIIFSGLVVFILSYV